MADALLKAPHTLLHLPRRHTLTFWRALLILGGLTMVYWGVQEAKLLWHCPRPIELTTRELAARTESPLWLRLSGLAPSVEVGVEASEGGNFKGVWLPLTIPDAPRTVVAIVRAPDRGVAASLQTGKTVSVEGLACFPRSDEIKNLGVYLSYLDVSTVPNLRIIEIGRAPTGLFGISLYFVFGLAIFGVAFCRLKAPQFGPEADEELVGFAEEPMVLVFDQYESEPLPEDVKVEVSHMLDNAWEGMERQS